MIVPHRTTRSAVLWITLGASLFTHVAYLVLDHEHYGADTPSYLIPARNLLHGDGFVDALHQPELRRTPGYPLILALFQIAPLKLEYLIVVQHTVCVLLAVVLAAITLRLTSNNVIALVAALALSLDLATIRIANLLLTETTAMALVALITCLVYLAITRQTGLKVASAAGILGGVSVLVRPVALFYIVPLSICIVIGLRKRSARPLAAFALSFVLLPTLWAVRNYYEAGYPGLSTISGEDLLFYRAAGVLAIRKPGNYLLNAKETREFLDNQTCAELEQRFGRGCAELTPAEKASYYTAKGVRIILGSPGSYLRTVTVGLAYSLFGGGAEALSKIANVEMRRAEFIVLLFTVPEACLALAGCWYWYRKNRNAFWLLTLTCGYFLMASAGAESYSRFRVPVMPLYAALIGGGAAGVLQLVQRFRMARIISGNHVDEGT